MLRQLAPAIKCTLVLAFVTGILFPILITGIAQLCFPHQANGSLITINNQIVGSELLGQQFGKPEYFHPRPSAAGTGYSGEASSGTNYGATSKKLILGDGSFQGVKQLAESYRQENNLAANTNVPVDSVTRSSSGMDPDITPANALLQAARVATNRNLSLESIKDLINRYTAPRDFGIFGEPRVNVLQLNLALDSHNQSQQ